MSMNRTKEQQFEIDRDLALYHGVDRDTPGGICGRNLRRGRDQPTTFWRPPKTVQPVAAGPLSEQDESSEKRGTSFGDVLVMIILLIIIL